MKQKLPFALTVIGIIIFPAVLICGLLSACAPAPSLPPPASNAEKDATGTALIVCLHNAARVSDDNKSPADSIALAILSTCASQNEQYKETFKQGMPFVAQRMFDQKVQSNNDDLKLATSVVLEERQKHPPHNQEQTDEQSSDAVPLEKGLDAENRGDYKNALRLLRPLAEHGNPFAQTTLGSMYQSGEGVSKDSVEASKWSRKAAEQGIPYAQFALGVNYMMGRGVSQDYVQAYKWIDLAAVTLSESNPEYNADIIKLRHNLAMLMTPAQIAEAERLASEWKPK